MYRTWILFISEKKRGGIQIIKLIEIIKSKAKWVIDWEEGSKRAALKWTINMKGDKALISTNVYYERKFEQKCY